MQTFFNPTTPFFDGEGRPLVGAMVSFLDLETSASLIPLTDCKGVALPNPLYTGMDGRLRLENGNGAPAVPCIADGLSYKVTVARRTGVEPVYIGDILQNADELYEEPDIAFVVTAMNKTEGTELNMTVVGSIADVRIANPDLGSVVCTGYYSAGDCPSRTFTWVRSQNPPTDNAVNVLRNPEDASGYWKMCDPDGGLWDIRIAGCSTSNTPEVNDQCLTRLVNVTGTSGIATVYFPAGNWLLDSGYTFGSLCLEKGANLKPADNTADRTVTVARLENRGGKFFAFGNGDADKRVVLVSNGGMLRTSWFKGTLNEFLNEAAVAAAGVIVFDSIDRNGSADVTITEKTVLVMSGVTVPNSITLDRDCIVINENDGSLHAKLFTLGKNWKILQDYVEGDHDRFKIVLKVPGIGNVVLFTIDTNSGISSPLLAKLASGLQIDDGNYWKQAELPDSDPWSNLVHLMCARGLFGSLRVTGNAIVGSVECDHGSFEELTAGTTGYSRKQGGFIYVSYTDMKIYVWDDPDGTPAEYAIPSEIGVNDAPTIPWSYLSGQDYWNVLVQGFVKLDLGSHNEGDEKVLCIYSQYSDHMSAITSGGNDVKICGLVAGTMTNPVTVRHNTGNTLPCPSHNDEWYIDPF